MSAGFFTLSTVLVSSLVHSGAHAGGAEQERPLFPNLSSPHASVISQSVALYSVSVSRTGLFLEYLVVNIV